MARTVLNHRAPDEPLHHGWVGSIVGGTVGFALGAVAHDLGLLWEVVPGGLVGGAAIGWFLITARESTRDA